MEGRRSHIAGVRSTAAVAVALPAAAIAGISQSALTPAGTSAAQIAELFWWMAGAATLIWLLVIGAAIYVTRIAPRRHDPKTVRSLVLGAGVVTPTIVLAALLAFSLPLMPELTAPGDPTLRIHVSGERWWWRVQYQPRDAQSIELANELRLPRGRRIELQLSSPDVIHAFWVPALAGKVDMIPGRTTRLVLEPTETGTFRGACAEYCGTSHALMNFVVRVLEPDAFETWLQAQAAPAAAPTEPLIEDGQRAFIANGCGACHTVRGTDADGRFGPDLTHVGSRLSLAAGVLPNDRNAFARWLGHTPQIKPDVRMPAFDMLPDDELAAIAAYLESLQ